MTAARTTAQTTTETTTALRGLRLRIPADLSERLRGRAIRDAAAGAPRNCIAIALRIIAAHVDDDLDGTPPPRRVMAPPPANTEPGPR